MESRARHAKSPAHSTPTWIPDNLNTGLVQVHYPYVSVIRMSGIQIPTVFLGFIHLLIIFRPESNARSFFYRLSNFSCRTKMFRSKVIAPVNLSQSLRHDVSGYFYQSFIFKFFTCFFSKTMDPPPLYLRNWKLVAWLILGDMHIVISMGTP